MSPTSAAAAIANRPGRDCDTCGNRGWSKSPDGRPRPCPTCKPYGARVGPPGGAGRHADGARVERVITGWTGTVLRSWRRTQGEVRPDRWTMCDVEYDHGLLAIAWEHDLMQLGMADHDAPTLFSSTP